MGLIIFTHLSVRNFNSWKRLEFPLDAQGVVCLRGLTGGGKSSIFKALYWCLFGSTPDAIRADEIRGSRKPTCVMLQMRKDSHDYMLTRYRGHPLLKNKVEFEGYGILKTDEDSLIKDVQQLINAFLGITPEVFLTTTYFAQRNFHVFHSLTDTGKKEWLESITYGSLFPDCENLVRERVRYLEREIAYNKGKLVGLEESLAEYKESQEECRESLNEHLVKIQYRLRKSITESVTLEAKLEKSIRFPSLMTKAKNAWEKTARVLEYAHRDYNRIKDSGDMCNVCGSSLDPKKRLTSLKEAQRIIDDAKEGHAVNTANIQSLTPHLENYERLQESFEGITEKINELRREVRRTEEDLKNLDEMKSLETPIKQTKNLIFILEQKLAYFKFWMFGFGFQGLRSYVLQTAANFLLDRLKYYLRQLASVSVEVDLEFVKNRIVLSFNNRSYGALSGGERQSVDLCTGFALRDVAEQYNKCRFNLSIYDEPFENLDDNLTTAAQALLLSSTKDSTFFITHRVISGRFDKVLSVEKSSHSRMKVIYG